jgi:hypothetical protein
MAEQGRPSFLKLLQSVNVLESLRNSANGQLPNLRDTVYGPMPTITIRCWNQATTSYREIVWEPRGDGSGPYPFYTLDDLKLAIYTSLASELWIPNQVFVCTAADDAVNQVLPLDTHWMERSANGSPVPLILPSPLLTCAAATRPLARFVELNGDAKLVERQDRGRTTLEDAYLIPREGTMPIFYAFCASDMIRRFGAGAGPVPAYDWNGRFRPYFPALQADAYVPTGVDKTTLRVNYKKGVRALLAGLSVALEQPLVAANMEVAGIYALRLLLNVDPVEGFAGCEEFFFRTAVTQARPFMRFLPGEGTAITKIYVEGMVPRPAIKDPGLIVQWAQELSPYADEDQDYLFIKMSIRDPEREAIFPLYATARVFHDSSADIIILPSKQQRILNPRIDMADLNIRISACLEGTYLSEFMPTIDETSLEIALNLAREDVPLTRARILQRLRIFSYFFQEAPNFDRESVPIIMLKYKAVSQFATEPRIFTYISQYFLKVQRGEAQISDQLVQNIASEFQITIDEAQDYARRFSLERDSFVLMAPEINTFSEENSSGIDIAIYGKHPAYQIRIYRCKSEMTLRRIYLLLSLLLSLEAEVPLDLSPAAEEEAAVDEAVGAEEEAAEDSVESSASSPPPAAAGAGGGGGPKSRALMTAMLDSASNESESPPASAASVSAQQRERQSAPLKSKALMTAMLNSASEDESESSPAAAAAPLKSKALMTAMLNSASEDESESPPEAAASVSAQQRERQLPPPKLTIKRSEAAAAPPPLSVKRAVPEPQVDLEGAADFPTKLRGYFAKQLAKIDPGLFAFKTSSDDNAYTRKCQASNGQQPIAINQSEYSRMMEEYANDTDIKVHFLEFPLKGGEPPVPTDPDIEVITLMKYGNDVENLNYYFCPRYFCHLDRIVILRSEFEEEGEWRNLDKAGIKPKNRCPFCGGSAISDQAETRPGQTVSVRKNKPKTNEIQDYIDFVSPTTHPKGRGLPCCYISPKRDQFMKKSAKLHISNPPFEHMRALAPAAANPGTVGADDVIEQYSIALSKFPLKYILGENHHPLAQSKFALVPKCLDAYFSQDSAALVSRAAIRQVMRPGAQGFFRMGVNAGGSRRDMAESFFNVLAPYLLKSTADEVRQMFRQKLDDINFFNVVNHGNLVNEYYKPSRTQYRPSDKELENLSEPVATEYNPAISKPEMRRLVMAHQLFKDRMEPNFLKEYRIFAPILAYPGLITSRGLVLILLEYDSTDTSAPVKVKCPPFGYQSNIYDSADFGFILRNQNGIYEALPFIEHTPVEGTERGRHRARLTFQVPEIPSLPPVIAQRREEFTQRCKAPMYTIYTGQTGVPGNTVMSYSQLISVEFQAATRGLAKPVAIVRDAYNHIAGCLFEYKYRADATYLIPFPLADHDGFIPIMEGAPMRFYFDWSAVPTEKLPSVPALTKFYADVLAAGGCAGYAPQEARKFRDRVVAVKLANGLLVPVDDNPKSSSLPFGEEDKEFEPEWQINRETVFEVARSGIQVAEEEEVPVEALNKARLDEIYQHFRLSVAQWLNSDEVDGDFVDELERTIIFRHDLPLFERRRRLEYVLRELYDWFVQDDEFTVQEPTFYRKDCRKIIDAGACSGTCKWKELGAGNKGKCAIHIPTQYEMGDDSLVDTAKVFVRRVVDELLLFPERRRQLLENMVKKTGTLTAAIQIGNQYIIPDTSPRWQELLSLMWVTDYEEEPTIMEEMSGDAPPDEEAPCVDAPRTLAIPRPRIRLQRAPEEAPAEIAAAAAAQPLGPLVPPGTLRVRLQKPGAAAPAPPPPLKVRMQTAAPAGAGPKPLRVSMAASAAAPTSEAE